MRRLLPLLLLTATCLPTQAEKPGDSVVTVVAGKPITLDQIDAIGDAQLAMLKDQLYWARLATVQEVVDRRVVEAEAKEQGLSMSAYMERELTAKITKATDEDVAQFWRENPKAAPPEQRAALTETIKHYVEADRIAPLRVALFDRLRLKHAPTLVFDLPTARYELDVNGRPSKGKATAAVTLAAFTDYQCGGCASLVKDLTALEGQFGEHLRVVHLDFPSESHDRAIPAAKAARCAGRFGKYWEYHDNLFLDTENLSDERLANIASDLGLDAQGFSECLADPQILKDIEADRAGGQAVAVTGTPHVFVNGLPLRGGLSTQQLGRAIAMELDRLGVRPPSGS